MKNEAAHQFTLNLIDLIGKYQNTLTPQEAALILIENAVNCSLYCLPNRLQAIKFILECVQIAIDTYEETHP